MNERDYERRQQAERAYHRKLEGEYHSIAQREYEMRQKRMDSVQRSSGGQGCFVATAAYGNYDAPEVVFLRAFRDGTLSQSILGCGFIRVYYSVSPSLAAVIAKSKALRAVTRSFFLQPTIFLLRYFKH